MSASITICSQALADASNGSVVMVGPSTKVDPATFPRRANLHWLGGRDYADLPAYAKSFDVCLMPFALNEATRIHQSDESAGIYGARASRSSPRRWKTWSCNLATWS